ncbi:MAG: hypothetical protein P8J78_03135 [Maricaulis sp.]|nr:hypothetical protein [Maricaulis sp.]
MTHMRGILGYLKLAFVVACLAISTSASAQDDEGLSEADFAQLLASDDTNALVEYLRARGFEVDERAEDVLAVADRLCSLEQRGGCVLAAEIITNSPIDAEEFENAWTFIREQCRQNYIPACWSLTRFLRTHDGSDEAYAQALRMDEYLCEHQYLQSCVTAGSIYRRGSHTERDYGRAAEFYSTACQENYYDSCYWYARMRRWTIIPPNLAFDLDRRSPIDQQIWLETHQLVEPLCHGDRNLAEACLMLAQDYFRGNGVAEDRARSLVLFERACTMGHHGSCAMAELAE